MTHKLASVIIQSTGTHRAGVHIPTDETTILEQLGASAFNCRVGQPLGSPRLLEPMPQPQELILISSSLARASRRERACSESNLVEVSQMVPLRQVQNGTSVYCQMSVSGGPAA